VNERDLHGVSGGSSKSSRRQHNKLLNTFTPAFYAFQKQNLYESGHVAGIGTKHHSSRFGVLLNTNIKLKHAV
jgi:hypothetical protein